MCLLLEEILIFFFIYILIFKIEKRDFDFNVFFFFEKKVEPDVSTTQLYMECV